MSQAAAQSMVRTAGFRRNPYWFLQRKERDASKLYHRRLARAGGGTNADGTPLSMRQSWPVVAGDLVQVVKVARVRAEKDTRGKWKKNADGSFVAQPWLGMQGVVMRVLRKQDRVIVKGVNMRTRVQGATAESASRFVKSEQAIPYANVALVDPATRQPVTGLVTGKVRKSLVTGSLLPRQTEVLRKKWQDEPASREVRPENRLTDTPAHFALQRTYKAPVIQFPSRSKQRGQSPVTPQGKLRMEAEDLELRVARIRF